MGGGMEANKNRFIEEWGSARENLEHNFRWSRRNFFLVGLFGIAVPVLVYRGIVSVRQVAPHGWSEGECNGKAGWFPSAYVERQDKAPSSKIP